MASPVTRCRTHDHIPVLPRYSVPPGRDVLGSRVPAACFGTNTLPGSGRAAFDEARKTRTRREDSLRPGASTCRLGQPNYLDIEIIGAGVRNRAIFEKSGARGIAACNSVCDRNRGCLRTGTGEN
jgi:hypothetical protein